MVYLFAQVLDFRPISYALTEHTSGFVTRRVCFEALVTSFLTALQLSWRPGHSILPRIRRSRLLPWSVGMFIEYTLGMTTHSFKCIQFLLAKWYKQSELSQRTALLACGILLSNAFGALIASAILDNMEGVWGFRAWRYATLLGRKKLLIGL